MFTMFTPVLAVNVISGAAIGLLIWHIGKSYDNPERLEGVRNGRIKKFKTLAIIFAVYAASVILLVVDK